jgi:hypothetical protein
MPNAVNVKVAGGAVLQCAEYFPQLKWTVSETDFHDTFRVLSLGGYDGIIGHDWLAKYSPMLTHWEHGWLAVPVDGSTVVLQGEGSRFCTHAMVELNLVHEAASVKEPGIPPEVQQILSQFAPVFETPTGLPPRRQCDHHIPLVPSARPISMRPYRVNPELKTELERQVQELLEQGVIVPSNSPFGSPVILVRKEDSAWRLVVDFR